MTQTETTTEVEEFVIERDGERPIKFTGELLGEVSSSSNNASSDYSGQTGRWSILRLYRTQAGKYVCEQIGKTQWQGEHNRYSGAVCDTDQQVVDFFGLGWLAKELYDECDIDYSEIVD